MILETTMQFSRARPRSRKNAPARTALQALSIVWIKAFLWLSLSAGEAGALDLEAQRTLVNKGVIGVLGDGARGTDFALIADLATLLDDGYDRRILPMAGTGSVRAIEDLLLLRGVDVAFVQADVLDFYKKADLFPEIDRKLAYLARLYGKEFHLLASKDIGSIQDLKGRKVNFGPPSSGSYLTASLVFDALGIEVEIRDDDYQTALDQLRQGEIDAWVRVDAKPSLQMTDLPSWEELHLLPLPPSAIEEPYVAAELTAEDYPGLIEAEDAGRNPGRAGHHGRLCLARAPSKTRPARKLPGRPHRPAGPAPRRTLPRQMAGGRSRGRDRRLAAFLTFLARTPAFPAPLPLLSSPDTSRWAGTDLELG